MPLLLALIVLALILWIIKTVLFAVVFYGKFALLVACVGIFVAEVRSQLKAREAEGLEDADDASFILPYRTAGWMAACLVLFGLGFPAQDWAARVTFSEAYEQVELAKKEAGEGRYDKALEAMEQVKDSGPVDEVAHALREAYVPPVVDRSVELAKEGDYLQAIRVLETTPEEGAHAGTRENLLAAWRDPARRQQARIERQAEQEFRTRFIRVSDRFAKSLKEIQSAPFDTPYAAYAFCTDMIDEMDAVQDMARELKPQGTVQSRCKEALMNAALSMETALFAGKKFSKSRDPEDLLVIRTAMANADASLHQWALWMRMEVDTMTHE